MFLKYTSRFLALLAIAVGAGLCTFAVLFIIG